MGWCTNFKKAIEEDSIRLIDHYEYWDSMSGNHEIEKIEKGWYIIDQYAEEEMCNENYPADPQVPLKYCPYCGATLTLTDI